MAVYPVCKRHFEISKKGPVYPGKGNFRRNLFPFWNGFQRNLLSEVHRVAAGERLVLDDMCASGIFMSLQARVHRIPSDNLVDKDRAGHPVGRIKRGGVKAIALHRVDYDPVIANIRLEDDPT